MKKRKRKKKRRDEQEPPVLLSASGVASQTADNGAAGSISGQPSPQTPATGPARPNYRSSRVAKENKKLINVPVDQKLKLHARTLMLTEGLTWEKLIEDCCFSGSKAILCTLSFSNGILLGEARPAFTAQCLLARLLSVRFG